MKWASCIPLALLVWGCDGNSDCRCAALDAGFDASLEDAGPPPPPWPHTLPASLELGEHRGLRVARTIVHLHSPLSHDACDGHGFGDGGVPDATCMSHLREALCNLHVDVANLTDHSSHVGEVLYEQLYLFGQVDEMIRDAHGDVVAGALDCPGGQRVLVTVGNEDALMSVGLHRHVAPLAGDQSAAYDADGPDAVTQFRAAGAFVFVPHTESRAIEYLRTVPVDGIEIYNTHANIDPAIRSRWLGLDSADFITRLLMFSDRRSRLEPDLSLLAFFEENHNDLAKWDTLLSEGTRVTGIAGCDAHENSFPGLLTDGERGDSYRRLIRWFSNHVLVRTVDRDAVLDALTRGRSYVAFEAFGSPVGFDFYAASEAATFEMGEHAPRGSTLHVVAPTLHPDVPVSTAPELELRIVRSTAAGPVVVGMSSGAELSFVAAEPGMYRAEVRIVPHHLAPYLGRLAADLVKPYVWIYANPVIVD